MPHGPAALPAPDPSESADVCRACGACCAYAADWPRFSLEADAWLDAIPAGLVAPDLSGMRFTEAGRCAALAGTIGEAVACTIYALRPQVCRDCLPDDDACRMARARHGMPPLA
ncbi:MAG: YkgJ family cysteine cluster protein [Hyphomicrobiaceae bacterium]|nr:YkgJ family cysteine cluster protein [Hyphomicrobiaceae bacterium]